MDLIYLIDQQNHLQMSFHVQRQMIASREGRSTEVAFERPIAGVLTIVPRQFVRSGKLPSASGPAAAVRLLSRVCPHVRLQVGTLRVRLGAVGERTEVNGLFSLRSSAPLSAARDDTSPDGLAFFFSSSSSFRDGRRGRIRAAWLSSCEA